MADELQHMHEQAIETEQRTDPLVDGLEGRKRRGKRVTDDIRGRAQLATVSGFVRAG
jgi:hypothetical protein